MYYKFFSVSAITDHVGIYWKSIYCRKHSHAINYSLVFTKTNTILQVFWCLQQYYDKQSVIGVQMQYPD